MMIRVKGAGNSLQVVVVDVVYVYVYVYVYVNVVMLMSRPLSSGSGFRCNLQRFQIVAIHHVPAHTDGMVMMMKMIQRMEMLLLALEVMLMVLWMMMMMVFSSMRRIKRVRVGHFHRNVWIQMNRVKACCRWRRRHIMMMVVV
jgi:hypothetical protein